MAAIHELLKQITDPQLRNRLELEVAHLTEEKKFGLVFEEHIPECTPLYGIPIKVGSNVARKGGKIDAVYMVVGFVQGNAICIEKISGAKETIPVEELVTVAQFGESIFPALRLVDSVENAPENSLRHTLIEADNYHALQLLEYLYAGKVDCIYIDPPYNTGARDWKYNNDYVDASDAYRHSKWLSMMKKRLLLAKRLLNPDNSVLIVTIDEKEYLHLGCLLEELFSEARMQMITTMTNKKGQPRDGIFSRCEEYIFVLFVGNAQVSRTTDNMLFTDEKGGIQAAKSKKPTIWNSLLRRGTGASRLDVPTLFYPIFVDEAQAKIVTVGDPIERDVDRNTIHVPEGQFATWPMHKDGTEGRWQMKPETLRKAIADGTAKLGQKDKKSGMWSIIYLKRKQLQQLKNGQIVSEGKDRNGALILRYDDDCSNESVALLQEPRSLWVRDLHDASVYGSTLIKDIIKGRPFSFPKSLYAVQDTLRFFVANKPNALIVDFFAGSGTTLHAVNLLNAEDGGKRRCILVTNNEVSESEAKALTKKGFHPGDMEWEKYGIAQYVTWPRTVCSIEGHDVNGNPLEGSYLTNDCPMSDGFQANCDYFRLDFLDKASVSLGKQFRAILPLLWMKAGAFNQCPELDGDDEPDMLILPKNRFAVLLNETKFTLFSERLAECGDDIETVYFITNSEEAYHEMSSGVKANATYQLYRDYIDNFVIGGRRQAE